MTRKFLYGLLIVMLLITSLVLSCTKTTSTSSTTQTTTTPQTTAAQVTTSISTSAAANWWDKFGEPTYGGTITMPLGVGKTLPKNFDPFNYAAGCVYTPYDILFGVDWISENRQPVIGGWLSDSVYTSFIVKSWEWTDLQTLVLHIQEGIKWQDKLPVNGREFTAYDIQYHYDRMLGTGSGFTQPSPFWGMFLSDINSVTATDNTTAVVKFKKSTPPTNWWAILDMNGQFLEPREFVELNDPTNWKNAAGTGPWIISDFIDNSSVTCVRNPDYWGHDERYPENKVPYADSLKAVQIQDLSTEIAALRTGQIDLAWDVDWKQAESLNKTNPELQKAEVVERGYVVFWRNDTKPFTDIRVRKALQMSIDRDAIVSGYYGGNGDPTPYGLIIPQVADYNYAYKGWSQTLKDEYSYNPAKAKELLTEAGYSQGFETNILTSAAMDNDLLQIIKSYFADIGVDMEIKVLDGQVYDGFISEGKDDQMHFWWSIEPPKMVLTLFTGRSNWARIHDANYDAIVDKFIASTDLSESKRLAIEADKYAIENHLSLRTPGKNLYEFWQPYIKGGSGEGHLSGAPRLQFLSRIWVDQESKEAVGR